MFSLWKRHTWLGDDEKSCSPAQRVLGDRAQRQEKEAELAGAWCCQEVKGTGIERQLFEETVKTLNNYYAEAEKIGGSSYLEGCLACATAYFIFLCMETHYEKVLKKISKFIQEQNEKIYAPRGLLLTDPLERGMRVIEISIYEDRCSSGSSSSSSSSSSSGGGGGGAGAR
ncbi:golgin subfamily A member 7B [Alligator mississippiensis]|uniref:Golgin subfamily A member 7B n=1 Tax=Alligator mississippiensis TaxID=8496 RepID=A0A151MLV0_ALLMI|nr:golgin subfamily A member 7B [Alligator mississippiensis]